MSIPGGAPLDAWAEFEARLTRALAAMEAATYLVVSVAADPRSGASDYVQFAQGGLLGFRAEAAANHWLPRGRGLDAAQEKRLAGLGWQRPDPASRDRNWVREWQEPVPFAEVAGVAVRTLREVYGASTPGGLRYRSGGFPAHRGPVPEPDLDIPPDRPVGEHDMSVAAVSGQSSTSMEPDQAAKSLETALTEFIAGAGLVPDRDGDLPIRIGSAIMFVRAVAGRPPLLQLFSPIVTGVDLTPALLDSLNDINRNKLGITVNLKSERGIDLLKQLIVNRNILFGRVFWTEREVVVSMELTSVGITASQIAFASVQLGNLADHLDDVLRGRFGGRTMFETPKTLMN